MSRGWVNSAGADAAGHRHLGHRDQHAAVGDVVAGAHVPARIWARTKSPLARSAARSTGGGAPSSRPAISRSQSDWPSQPLVAPISTTSSHGRQREADRLRRIVQHAEAADRRGGQDRAALGLVVEADVAGHDREVERLAGRRHAADRGGELAHDLRLFRVAEIHVVGERQRARADRGEVAPGLGHRLRAAFLGVGGAVARRAVGGQRQRRALAVQLHHGGVGGAGALHRLAADGAVVLVPDPGARAEVRAADQLLQCAGQAEAVLDAAGVQRSAASAFRWWGGGRAAPGRSAAPAGCRPRPRRGGGPRCGRCRSGGR